MISFGLYINIIWNDVNKSMQFYVFPNIYLPIFGLLSNRIQNADNSLLFNLD